MSDLPRMLAFPATCLQVNFLGCRPPHSHYSSVHPLDSQACRSYTYLHRHLHYRLELLEAGNESCLFNHNQNQNHSSKN